jgi:NADP-dependent 3-hydroxy acid dehydrogenase YdfG
VLQTTFISNLKRRLWHRLRAKTILIVGAGSGIGLATARQTATLGAHVIMLSRSTKKLEAAAREVNGSREMRALDMQDEAAIAELLPHIHTIDRLVLTAVADENKRQGRLADLTVDQMERSFDKFRGFFLWRVPQLRSYLGTDRSPSFLEHPL